MTDEINQNIQKKDGESVPAIRTFESDVADLLKKGKTSVTDVVVAQNTQTNNSFQTVEPEKRESVLSKKSVLIISGAVILALASSYAAYLIFSPSEPPLPPLTSAGQSIIKIDSVKAIDLYRTNHSEAIASIVREREGSAVRLNSIEGLLFKNKNEKDEEYYLETQEFLKKISPNISSALLRSLDKGFAFGLLGHNGNQPFLIFKTSEYQNAYSAMLKSEPDFYREAGEIFFLAGSSPTLPTSTVAYFSNDPRNMLFKDIVVRNIDTRAVKNSEGKIILMYAFPNNSTLIITTNQDVFAEILEKLKRGR